MEGWKESAQAWIDTVEDDISRKVVLDPVMMMLVGDVSAKHVLDVGCGEGRFCRMLAARGAKCTGIDPIETFIHAAQERDPNGRYLLANAEDLPFEEGSFDLVVSYLTLIDIPDFRRAIQEMARVMKPGGRLVLANLTSHNTASPDGWVKDQEDKKLYFPIDDYLDERGVWVEWKGIRIVNYHRPLESYMQAFLRSGLVLREFLEPGPSQKAVGDQPAWKDIRRVGYFNVMVWQKPEARWTGRS